MKLKKVQFEEFRSISGGSLDIEQGITSLVGINESGKSNVLFALEKADKKEKLENVDITKNSKRVYSDNESPRLKLFFDVLLEESQQLIGVFGFKEASDLHQIVLAKEGANYSLDFPAINYEKSSFFQEGEIQVDKSAIETIDTKIVAAKESISNKKKENSATSDKDTKKKIFDELNDLEAKLGTLEEEKKIILSRISAEIDTKTKEKYSVVRKAVIDKIIKENLPKFLFFDSVGIETFNLPPDGRVDIEKLITNPGKNRPVVNLLYLGGITELEFLRGGDARKNNLRAQRLKKASTKINNEMLRKHWPLEDVEFEISIEETNFLCIRLKENGDDAVFTPGDRSRGLQWSVAFNIYFLSESQGGELKNAILLIDEPGVFLHIDAQKKLLEETFPAILSGGNQIIYTTHLPYLIHPTFPERIRILERGSKGGATIIGNKAWSEGRVSDIPEPVKTALGTKWTEWFGMKDDNCIVEGPSDQVILRSLISKIGGEYNFIPAYGYELVPSALAIAKLDNKNSIGVVDDDLSRKDRELLSEKLSFVNISEEVIVDISTLSGNEQIKTVEDVIPEHIFKKAVFRVYRQLLPDIKEEGIPSAYPRISTIEKFVTDITGEKSHSFKKMEIARAVADISISIIIPSLTDPKWTIIRKIKNNLGDLLSKKLLLQRLSQKEEKEVKSKR